jgi:hypothetical protein
MFLFEKKNQKPLSSLAALKNSSGQTLVAPHAIPQRRQAPHNQKFFASFFQKRRLSYSVSMARISSLAFSQSRRTVRSVTPSASPISTSVKPPK